MLSVARANVRPFAERIELVRVDAKGSSLPAHAFDVVMSNSIVHHIPEPALFFAEVVRLCAPGGLIFVRDLERPRDEAALRHLSDTYARDETARARGLFEDSLRAALTVDEVAELVRPYGVPRDAVTRTSDRHWTMAVRR
jgi:SAM-dependent methyltransferase